MKYLIYLSVTLLFSTSVFSQDSTQTLKPVAGDRVLSIGLINNSAFWMAKKYQTDKKACRIGITGSFNAQPKSSSTSSNNLGQSSTLTGSSSSFAIGLYMGAQKSFGDLKRVEPYVGLDFGVFYSYSERSTEIINHDPSAPSRSITETKNPFRMSLSVLPLVGVNYYIAPRFAIGAEYRLSIASANYETGNYSKTESQYIGTSTTSETKQDKGTFSFNSNLSGTAYITATLFFH